MLHVWSYSVVLEAMKIMKHKNNMNKDGLKLSELVSTTFCVDCIGTRQYSHKPFKLQHKRCEWPCWRCQECANNTWAVAVAHPWQLQMCIYSSTHLDGHYFRHDDNHCKMGEMLPARHSIWAVPEILRLPRISWMFCASNLCSGHLFLNIWMVIFINFNVI